MRLTLIAEMRKVAAFMAKPIGAPAKATTNPAVAGPTTVDDVWRRLSVALADCRPCGETTMGLRDDIAG